MYELFLIGMGSGNPKLMTQQAVEALQSADLLLIPLKGEEKRDLADLRRQIRAEFLTGKTAVLEFDLPKRDDDPPDYLGEVRDWHDTIAKAWARHIAAGLPEGGKVALLIWGDPSLYDSSLRIAERLTDDGLIEDLTVIPGITSLQLLTAAHKIPLNTLGAAVQITTGRRLREEGWPDGVETLAVMLDGGTAFETLDPEGVTIYWGAYLGMAQEFCLSGPLAEAGPRIIEARAAARAEHGWIMDIYLLRRAA